MATTTTNPPTETNGVNGVNTLNGPEPIKPAANLPLNEAKEVNGAAPTRPDIAQQPTPAGDAKAAEQKNPNTNNSQPQKNGSALPKPLAAGGSGLKKAVNKAKKPPGGFDTTPLPNAPQGYTIRFIFHHAANLPPADLSTVSSDPFLTATLKASSPKRHKEDPELVHRTRTIRRTTEPEWNEEWVVANVPPSGFSLKCRLYDEDAADHDDRLGNVTIKVPQVHDQWDGIPPPGKEFEAKKRMMSKRAFLAKGIASLIHSDTHITPRLCVSMEVLGKSDPPYAQMYTLGPTMWTKHFSPMIGRLAGTKVNKDEEHDQDGGPSQGESSSQAEQKKSQKYE